MLADFHFRAGQVPRVILDSVAGNSNARDDEQECAGHPGHRGAAAPPVAGQPGDDGVQSQGEDQGESAPAERETIANLSKLASTLRGRRYSEADIAGVMGQNWIGLLEERLLHPQG